MIALAAVLIISAAILLWQYVRGDLEDYDSMSDGWSPRVGKRDDR